MTVITKRQLDHSTKYRCPRVNYLYEWQAKALFSVHLGCCTNETTFIKINELSLDTRKIVYSSYISLCWNIYFKEPIPLFSLKTQESPFLVRTSFSWAFLMAIRRKWHEMKLHGFSPIPSNTQQLPLKLPSQIVNSLFLNKSILFTLLFDKASCS